MRYDSCGRDKACCMDISPLLSELLCYLDVRISIQLNLWEILILKTKNSTNSLQLKKMKESCYFTINLCGNLHKLLQEVGNSDDFKFCLKKLVKKLMQLSIIFNFYFLFSKLIFCCVPSLKYLTLHFLFNGWFLSRSNLALCKSEHNFMLKK